MRKMGTKEQRSALRAAVCRGDGPAIGRLARRGYRVLAVAERDASGRRDLREDRVNRLCFAGLLGLADSVRDTAARAVRGLRAAGVNVMMLTGDHPSTAEAIAAELDLIDGWRVVTGPDLDKLPGQAGVFARVSPDQKVRIVVGAQLGQTLLAGVIQTPAMSQFFGCRPPGLAGGIGTGAAATASLGAPLISRVLAAATAVPPAAAAGSTAISPVSSPAA